jgi:polysaccharide biosynthesis transport protein
MSYQLPPQSNPGVPLPVPGDDVPVPWEEVTKYDREHERQKVNQLGRVVSALMRYKWWIILATLIGTAAGVGAAQFVTPTYETQSTLWVESRERGNESGPIQTDELLSNSAWIELLRSYVVLDPVVREQQLYLNVDESDRAAFSTFNLEERFSPGEYQLKVDPTGKSYVLTRSGIQVETGSVGAPVGARLGFRWNPTVRALRPDRTINFEVLTPRDVAVRLSGEVRADLPGNGNFLRLSLAGTDAAQITGTLNALAKRYVEVAAQLKRAKLDELSTVLDEQRRYAEENLRTAELDLQNHRVQTITLPSGQSAVDLSSQMVTRDPVVSGFFDLRVEREQLRTDREAIERILSEASRSGLSLDALMMIPSAAASAPLKQVLTEHTDKLAELRSLQGRYTSEYRPVQQLTERIQQLERVVIPRLAQDVQAQLLDREQLLETRISTASSEIRQIPPRAIEEARLQRRVSIAENLNGTLKQRYEEARLAAASTIPDIRVLDPAVLPTAPVRDPRISLILLGFVGSLGISLVGIVALDRYDPKVRYPEQVSVELGLSILGVIPNVKEVGGHSEKNITSYAAEAFRELRLGLAHAHGAAGPVLLTITSPESGDGKSFVSSNLALSFADQGYRTLVIDGDIRRGRMHRILGGTRTPGLTDYLSGAISQEEVLQPTSFPSVYLIGSGTRMHNGPELLGSPAMSRLIVSLRSQFDVILIDSPPLGAGIDAYALGTLTRNLLLVMRTGATNRAFAEAKLAMLDRLPVRVLGAVLNATPNDMLYRYHYAYLPGYEAQEESATEESTELARIADGAA